MKNIYEVVSDLSKDKSFFVEKNLEEFVLDYKPCKGKYHQSFHDMNEILLDIPFQPLNLKFKSACWLQTSNHKLLDVITI